MAASLVRIGLYLLVLAAPLVMATAFGPPAEGYAAELGMAFALLGFTILAMQFVLSARLKWMERPFGLDVLFRFHKAMAVFATVLLLLHPVLLAIGEGEATLLVGYAVPWPIWMGRGALLILLAQVVLSLYRLSLRLEYERWRRWHNVAALLILGLGFTHSWSLGGSLKASPMQLLWSALLGVALLAYFYHRFWRARQLRHHSYRVIDVVRETHDVWTIALQPPEGGKRHDYLPGQFHFLTFYREGLPVEEHPWTISSSPTEEGCVRSTIKESGDFTATIGRTKSGDRAAVSAPFGRFSYVLHPEESDLIFIAGGIGITPLMSMLRHMRDAQADLRVLLLYTNKTADDIVFRDELSALEAGERPRLRVVHVLSGEPGASATGGAWGGETGHVDREKIARCCGGVAGKAFYVCGPASMMDAAIAALQELGVAAGAIHTERFSL
jgi:predicted ferric reductase